MRAAHVVVLFACTCAPHAARARAQPRRAPREAPRPHALGLLRVRCAGPRDGRGHLRRGRLQRERANRPRRPGAGARRPRRADRPQRRRQVDAAPPARRRAGPDGGPGARQGRRPRRADDTGEPVGRPGALAARRRARRARDGTLGCRAQELRARARLRPLPRSARPARGRPARASPPPARLAAAAGPAAAGRADELHRHALSGGRAERARGLQRLRRGRDARPLLPRDLRDAPRRAHDLFQGPPRRRARGAGSGLVSTALEERYRARSLWLDGLEEPLTPRPALAGDRDCDVAIVGAGFTGLWAAYFLASLQRDLRIAIVEREIAGFGPSGRNGGWASAGLARSAARHARLRGDDAVRRGERAMADAVSGIGRVIAEEGIECGWLHGGSLLVATSAPQVARLHQSVERRRAFGMGEDDLRLLEPPEIYQRVRVRGARAASFTPHCGRLNPARLARGLALACERRGVVIYEGPTAESSDPGRVRCVTGTLLAGSVLRATEAYTVQQPGQRRLFIPLYSLMIATEPLPREVWEELGWDGRETVSDLHHLFFYAQRTPDDRIAIGGRGAPYRLGSPIEERY